MRDRDVVETGATAPPRPAPTGGAEVLPRKPLARQTPPSMRRGPAPLAKPRSPRPADAFRLLFRQNPLPVWVFDRESLRILDVNEAALRTYGYSRDEFLALTTEALQPQEDVGRPASAHEARRHRTRDGTLLDVELASRPLDFAGRKAMAVFAMGLSPARSEEGPRSASPRSASPAAAPPGRTGQADQPPDGTAGGAVATLLRERMLGDLYAGRLHAGDRLPSIREVADELGATNWSVSDAYRILAREGLVERRARSGVFVAPQGRRWGSPVPETAEWLADVLTQASDHLIRVPIFPDLVRRYTAAVQLRCACVESDLDSLTALCTESAMQFGLDAYPVHAGSLAPRRRGSAEVPAELRDADLLLTTAFHAPLLRPVAESLGKPLIVAALDPDAVLVIRRHLDRQGELTVVCADPAFSSRLGALLGAAAGERLRIVLARDADEVARLDPADALLLTRAAGQRLEGMSLRLLVPRFPSFSRESGRALAEALIRLNLGSPRA